MDIKHLGKTAVPLPLEGVDGVRFDGALDIAHERLNAGEESRERVHDDRGELSSVHIDAAILEKQVESEVLSSYVACQPLASNDDHQNADSAMLTQKPSGART